MSADSAEIAHDQELEADGGPLEDEAPRELTRGEILKSHIEEFRSNLRALANFVDNVEPVIEAQLDSTYEEHVRRLAAYSMFMQAVHPGADDDVTEIDSFGWSVSITRESSDERGGSFRLDGDPDHLDEFTRTVDDLARNPSKRREAVKCMAHVPRQQKLLYETSLISLVSIVEWFYSQLMTDLYRWFPDRLNTKDACFSLRDLEGFDSIADAVEQMIEDRVTKHVHESVDVWLDDLVKWFGVPGDAPAVASRAHVIEVVRRRDVFVHNGGCVSRLYLARVGKEDPKMIAGLSKGDRLNVDGDYLDDAIELMETAFISLALAAWKKAANDDPGFRAHYLLDLSYDALCEGRHMLAAYIGSHLAADKDAPDWEKTAARVNMWLASKGAGDFDSVQSEVAAFDVSALAEEFKIAKLALLDEHERIVEDLVDLLDRRAVLPDQLRDWPLFAGLRESDLWSEVEQIIATSESSQEQADDGIAAAEDDMMEPACT